MEETKLSTSYAVLAWLYLLVTAWWYTILQRSRVARHEKSSTFFQLGLLLVMGLGFVQMCLGWLDLHVCDSLNKNSLCYPTIYTVYMIVAVKQTMSRCLLLGLSMGQDVTSTLTKSSSSQRYKNDVAAFGVVYLLVAISEKFGTILWIRSTVLSSPSGQSSGISWLLSAKTHLARIVWCLNTLCVVWIVVSLSETLTELRQQRNDESKRYASLRWLLGVSCFVFGCEVVIFRWCEMEAYQWLFLVVMELNCLGLLTSVAYLWRPKRTTMMMTTTTSQQSNEEPLLAVDHHSNTVDP